jgi:hypothetical protein
MFVDINIKGWQGTCLWSLLTHTAGSLLEIVKKIIISTYLLPRGLSRTLKCRLRRECGTHGRKEKWVDNVKEGDCLEYLGINVRVTLNFISKE